jgi:hypothetical protein
MTSTYIKEHQLVFNFDNKEKEMTNVGKRMWKAVETNYVLSGIIVDEKIDKNGWLLVKIDWELPHSEYIIKEWQRAANVRILED